MMATAVLATPVAVELAPPAGKPPAAKRHLPALTGLRFILAIWVILHHLTGRGMMLDQWVQTMPPAMASLIRGGYLAVGTFFVLSGFVLARSYGEKPWNRGRLLSYGIARIARVYPGYLLSLVIVSPWIVLYLFLAPADAAHKAALMANYIFVLQGWTGSRGVGWNTPAWSLSCELFFYLCFPLLMVWFGKRTPLRLATAASIVLLLPVALSLLHVPFWWKPLIHTADFLAGIVASHVFDILTESRWQFVKRLGPWMYGFAALAGVLIVAFPAPVKSVLDLNHALRPVNFLLLIGLAIGGGFPARLLSTRIARYLGQSSYSMYILHVPLLWCYTCALWRTPTIASQTATAALYIACVIVISALAFQWVEEPANQYIRRWSISRAA